MSRERHELDYDALAKDYVENLHTTLRNFTPGPEFLETWVYEENHDSSVLGILESAEEADLAGVTITISRAIADEMDLDALKSDSGHMKGLALTIEDRGADGVTVQAEFAADSAAAEYQIHAVYERNVRQAADHVRQEGELPAAADGEIQIEAKQGDAVLSCNVNTSTHLVSTARHSGAQGLLRVLLDQLCPILEDRTLQEGNDHAIIRLEYKLRDFGLPHPIAGIITPDNADPAFAEPQGMVRSMYKQYIERTGAKQERNFWDDAPADVWKKLDTPDKMERASFALEKALTELKLGDAQCDVVDVKDDVRIVISYTSGANDLAPNLIKLERVLRNTLDPRLELQMESIVDKNKREMRTQRNTAFKH